MLIRVPMSWLREYVDVTIPADELGDRLHMSGTELKGIERRKWDKIWVGRVAELSKHPNADKLSLATVDYGEGRRKVVATGATNLKPGSVIAYGEVGAEYTDGHTGERMVMKPRDMRGIKSEGMVLSEKELGIGEDHEGIMLLDDKLTVGAPLSEVLGETVLLLELQPNRPDCLGIVGVAREVSALLRQKLREPVGDPLGKDVPKSLDVRIEDAVACPRFAAARLDNIRVGPSPEWMQQRLIAAGMRPISNVVDITNYVMLELGQPLHAYDLREVKGGTLVARQARPEEHLRTLDGIDRALPEGTLVIADEERALGIAGIMGGENSEIRDDTTTVALECASFDPRSIGPTSTRLGLRGSSGSAAARRFSWQLSPDLVPSALARTIQLLREYAGARHTGTVDRYPRPRQPVEVRIPLRKFARHLGMEVTREDAVGALSALGFAVTESGDSLVARPPAVRTDIAIPEDLIEEVARIVGYDRLPTGVPDGPLPLVEAHPREEFRERLRDALVGMGLQETVSYSLIDPEWLERLSADGSAVAPCPLRIQNPTTPAQSVARPTLRASLLDTARRNLRHRDGLAIFEIAPVYLPREHDLPEERWIAAILVAGTAQGDSWLGPARISDLWDLKAIVDGTLAKLRVREVGEAQTGAPGLHPGRSERRGSADRDVMIWGQLDPRVADLWELPAETFLAELDVAALLDRISPSQVVAPPRYPAAIRDLAIVLDEATPYAAIEEAIRAAGKTLVESVSLLDLYRGPQVGAGKKSLAVRLVLRSVDGTLTDADVDRAVKRIEGRLLHQLAATIRA
ncbi:MAG: phenylalanine--tRNA ligase subunit beta [Chloroflexota bacterium]|nr:phenylalanine--tRNA ligase subunit beta [Chloroflexota bacterium]